jgi:excinuclease ABC subunit B
MKASSNKGMLKNHARYYPLLKPHPEYPYTNHTMEFRIVSDFGMTGDQPEAVAQLSEGLERGHGQQTLLGVTGSGKTFTMANIVARVQRPTLVLCHNKTLAAQLYAEFKEFFPDNAVEYFVSYYDYYQPEAYLPATDTYIEKDADINDEIDKLRNAATRALIERRDVLIVASVSCIYGLGAPEEYLSFLLNLKKGETMRREKALRRLVEMQYERNDLDFSRGKFRVRGDTLEIQPAYEDMALRLEFFGDEVERIARFDPLTGEVLAEMDEVTLFPAKHFVTSPERLKQAIVAIREELTGRLAELNNQGKLLEASRLESRTNYDLEMLTETGYCSGVENYSRHLSARAAGSTPYTLLNYFPDDYLTFIDESHMTIPQVRGMFRGDLSRKQTLVDYGFRLPSAIDNRPLNFDEFSDKTNQVIYVSATPQDYEREHSRQTVEQLVRPTGLLEPTVEIKPVAGQVDDLLEQVNIRVERHERCLITTLTKRMAEDLAEYLIEAGVKTHYLHSEIVTLERVSILRDLRLGVYDVVVGINLLREGLDLPEVSMVAILDADKQGYLRSRSALVQTMGRAARHVSGHVIMYADIITDAMAAAISETRRRREVQEEYNRARGITPQGISKAIRDITERVRAAGVDNLTETETPASREAVIRLIKDLETRMKNAARELEFEKAALLRDHIIELRKGLIFAKLEK